VSVANVGNYDVSLMISTCQCVMQC